MRKVILSLHTTLDGFVAGPNGEMDWIKVDEEIFDLVATFTDEADTALYGRVTYEMMESYWPTAGHEPNASKHDKEHSEWYNRVDKVVLSKTMPSNAINKLTVISGDIHNEINNLKQQTGKNILMFGSPSAAHSLMQHNLIDEYWLFINPVILGQGIPVFSNITEQIKLKPLMMKAFKCGVTGLHYSVER
jgi:dihydrofolate reductase